MAGVTLFYLNIPVALAIAAVTGALVYGRGFHRRVTRFDSIGFILLAVVLGGLQTILNQGNDFEWFQSPFLSGVLLTVIVALSASSCLPTAISRSAWPA